MRKTQAQAPARILVDRSSPKDVVTLPAVPIPAGSLLRPRGSFVHFQKHRRTSPWFVVDAWSARSCHCFPSAPLTPANRSRPSIVSKPTQLLTIPPHTPRIVSRRTPPHYNWSGDSHSIRGNGRGRGRRDSNRHHGPKHERCHVQVDVARARSWR